MSNELEIINSPELLETGYLLPEISIQNKDKKTLVLDLDETLLHSQFEPFEIKSDIMLQLLLDGEIYDIHVLIRPHVKEFLIKMSKLFEIVVFTASISNYANPLLNEIDNNNLCNHRLYREHCTVINALFVKDLSKLGRKLSNVIILDNSPYAYALHTENGLPILPFYDNKKDEQLLMLIPVLEFLAKVPDVRDYIPRFVENDQISFIKATAEIKLYNTKKKFLLFNQRQSNTSTSNENSKLKIETTINNNTSIYSFDNKDKENISIYNTIEEKTKVTNDLESNKTCTEVNEKKIYKKINNVPKPRLTKKIPYNFNYKKEKKININNFFNDKENNHIRNRSLNLINKKSRTYEESGKQDTSKNNHKKANSLNSLKNIRKNILIIQEVNKTTCNNEYNKRLSKNRELFKNKYSNKNLLTNFYINNKEKNDIINNTFSSIDNKLQNNLDEGTKNLVKINNYNNFDCLFKQKNKVNNMNINKIQGKNIIKKIDKNNKSNKLFGMRYIVTNKINNKYNDENIDYNNRTKFDKAIRKSLLKNKEKKNVNNITYINTCNNNKLNIFNKKNNQQAKNILNLNSLGLNFSNPNKFIYKFRVNIIPNNLNISKPKSKSYGRKESILDNIKFKGSITRRNVSKRESKHIFSIN